MTLRAPPDLEELRFRASMERAEWTRLLAHAEARVPAARAAQDEARERFLRTRSPTARMDLARAVRRADDAERDALLLLAIWDTTARVRAIHRLRIEETDWMEEGAIVQLHDKAAPDGSGTRTRPGFLNAATTARLRAWRASLAPDATLPAEGPMFPGHRSRALSVQAIEEIVHNLALGAGVQKYLPSGPAKKSHRFLVTTNAIRELAEDVAIENGAGEDTAARAAGHSVRTARKHYRQAGADHARRAALARRVE